MFDIFNMLKKDETKAVKQVTRETIIGDILDMDQSTAPYFMEIGMHCLGCPASRGESIEEACAVHGVDCDELIEKLNEHLAAKKAFAAAEAGANNKAASDVKELINAIGKVELAENSKALIDAARKAYDALTEDQKKLILAEELKVLTDAEEAYDALDAAAKAEAEKKAKEDAAKADAVKKAIAAMVR